MVVGVLWVSGAFGGCLDFGGCWDFGGCLVLVGVWVLWVLGSLLIHFFTILEMVGVQTAPPRLGLYNIRPRLGRIVSRVEY